MYLHEHRAKELFSQYGIPLPAREVAGDPAEAVTSSEKIGLPVVLKAQLLEGGRGKAGLITMVDAPSEIRDKAEALFSVGKTRGFQQILVEKKIAIKKEYYLSVTIDQSTAQPLIIFGKIGGVDIEKVSGEHPESLFRENLDVFGSSPSEQIQSFAAEISVDSDIKEKLRDVIERLVKLFMEKECILAEINPLALSSDDRLVALDAKVMIDDNCLYRHSDLKEIESEASDIPLENEASERGLTYVHLDGDIGVMSSGAGLGMFTVDMIRKEGGSPANFMDIKGSEREKNRYQETRMMNEMDIVLSNPRVKVLLINKLHGLSRCDEVAMGIRKYLQEHEVNVPTVVRLAGTRSEYVHEILKNEDVILVENLDEAVSAAMKILKGRP